MVCFHSSFVVRVAANVLSVPHILIQAGQKLHDGMVGNMFISPFLLDFCRIPKRLNVLGAFSEFPSAFLFKCLSDQDLLRDRKYRL